MSTYSRSITIGDPIPELPLTVRQGSSAMWDAVAATCRQHPGMWVPVTIPGIKDRRQFHNVRALISGGRVKAFAEGTWDATREGDTIYVQLVGDDNDPTPEAAVTSAAEASVLTLDADQVRALRSLADLLKAVFTS